MSVPSYLRKENKVKFLDDARLLVKHTLTKCTTESNFAKRYRWCVTQNIVNSALEMYSNIRKANAVFVNTAEDYKLRRNYQKRAYAETDSLLGLIDIAYEQFNKLTSEEIKHWVTLVRNAQCSLKNWIESDTKKYAGL